MSPAAPATTRPPPPRDAAWDVARGAGVLCVIAAHSVGPYLSRPLPGLLWPVYEPAPGLWQPTDPSQGPAPAPTDVLFWLIRAFTVPLFFFIAGLFAAQSMSREGPRAFLRSRLQRLGAPLLAGYFLVMPLVYVVWVWGWVRFGYAAWEHLRHMRFGPAVQPNLHGFGHLWYLWYLLLMCTGAAAWTLIAPAKPPPPPDAAAHQDTRAALRVLAPAALALLVLVPVAALLPTAVQVFQNGFFPRAGFFLFHAMFFMWGWAASAPMLDPHSAPRRWTARLSPLLIIAGALCALQMLWTLFPALHIHQNQPPPTLLTPKERWRVGVLASGAALLLVPGVVGTASALAHRAPAWLPALGRRSLWVYTTHMPWVGLVAVALFKVPLPAELKAAAAFAAALAMSLLTRRVFSATAVGRWLGA
ncbi:MAG: acyltransferase family protein [Phycisphaerales bacterium]